MPARMEQPAFLDRAYLEATLSSIGDGVIATNCERTITLMNATAANLVGWSEAEAIGRSIEEVFLIEAEDTGAPAAIPIDRALEDGCVVGLANHTVLVARDGSRVPIDDCASPIRGEDGIVRGAVLVFRDISRRRAAERKLAQSERRYRTVAENTTDGAIFWFDSNLRYLYCGGSGLARHGLSQEQLIGKTMADVFPPEVVSVADGPCRAVFDGVSSSYEVTLGDRRYHNDAFPVRDSNGMVTEGVVITLDITEQRNAERRLAESRVRFRNAFHHSLIGLFYLGTDGSILEVNDRMLEILGSPSAEATKQVNVLTFPPLVEAGYAGALRKCLETGEPHHGQSSYESKWGKRVYVDYTFNPVVEDGEIVGVVASVDDLTELRQTAAELTRQTARVEEMLEEKEVLLRELYHRTKNNMQVIASMLSIRRMHGLSGPVEELLKDLENKVHTMALVHEKLYHSASLSAIDLGQYLREVAELVVAAAQDERTVSLVCHCESVPGLIEIAVPLGLVVNELVTNAFKHAFPTGDHASTLTLTVRRYGAEGVQVVVADNGRGIPEARRAGFSETLGVRTISAIVTAQLGGHIAADYETGTRWTITIEEPPLGWARQRAGDRPVT